MVGCKFGLGLAIPCLESVLAHHAHSPFRHSWDCVSIDTSRRADLDLAILNRTTGCRNNYSLTVWTASTVMLYRPVSS